MRLPIDKIIIKNIYINIYLSIVFLLENYKALWHKALCELVISRYIIRLYSVDNIKYWHVMIYMSIGNYCL